MLRHTIKMAWFDANCEDKPFKGIKNLEELTEEQQQKRAEERYHLKKLAEQYTDTLDSYIDKLATDTKNKEKLKAPIYPTQHNLTNWKSFILHSHIVYRFDKDMKDGLTKHIIERAAMKKGAFKKIAEIVEQENQRKTQYFQFLHAKSKAMKLR